MKPNVVRMLLSLAVAAMGAVDLLSAILSHPSDRLLAIRQILPPEMLDTSRTFTLLAGALLLVTAWGLRRGKRRAFVAALFLCAVSIPFNLLKALDFEEATLAAALMFLLGLGADSFRVKSRGLSFMALRSRALWFGLGLVLYAFVGCWILELRYGTREASLSRALGEALYQLLGVGSPSLDIPRSHRVVEWFLGSIGVMSFTVLVLFAIAVLRPAAHRGKHRAQAARVAELVRRHGDSSVAWFALDRDVDYFFSANARAVIAYRFESDSLLVIGDPIGPGEETPTLLEEFERFCHEHDWRFAFYQARPERLPLYRARGWRVVHVGEDPVIRVASFSLEGPAVADVRRTVRRREREGLTARMFLPGGGAFDPARDAEGLAGQLREISTEWLKLHPGGEKGFCMGRFDPHQLAETWLAVAWDPARHRAEAFCTFVPIPARHGWALDLMRRRPDAVSGATEFLIVKSVETMKERGDAVLSLSLSALARVDRDEPAGGDAQAPDDRAREFLMERLARFYDFKGLFRWKRKFDPEFEPRYLVYPEPLALPAIALALVKAQAPGGLLSYVRPAA
ncbi:MAG TPA: phosphatidylglycerol lysyltransferase domain-containing protein [Candidatus Eisenbacteria bacterium]|jgi:phosphatidylglycerol lysyltransferase